MEFIDEMMSSFCERKVGFRISGDIFIIETKDKGARKGNVNPANMIMKAEERVSRQKKIIKGKSQFLLQK